MFAHPVASGGYYTNRVTFVARCGLPLVTQSVGSLRRSHPSGVGGEADMPTSLKRRD